MTFTRFKSPHAPAHQPTATLSAEGTILLNREAMEVCVAGATFVELYFDDEKRMVGLKFQHNPGEPGVTRRLTRYSRNSKSRSGLCATVQCREFYREFCLPKRHLRRPLAWDEKTKLWTFKVAATQ